MKKDSIKIFALMPVVLLSFSVNAQNESWVAPADTDKLTNPLKGNASAIEQGKVIYQSMCTLCHGESGKGDGAASLTLARRPANFLSLQIKKESDGAIFWKMTEGRPPMASYRNLLTEQQRWQLVEYIRKLQGKQ